VSKNLAICEDHFCSGDFFNFHKTRLKSTAIPHRSAAATYLDHSYCTTFDESILNETPALSVNVEPSVSNNEQ
jgi:hypothetical protein